MRPRAAAAGGIGCRQLPGPASGPGVNTTRACPGQSGPPARGENRASHWHGDSAWCPIIIMIHNNLSIPPFVVLYDARSCAAQPRGEDRRGNAQAV